MPSLYRRVKNLLEPFISLLQKIISTLFKQKFCFYNFGRPSREDAGTLTSTGTPTADTSGNSLNKPQFGTSLASFTPTRSSTPPIDDHLIPPRSFKKKALLVGVEVINDEISTERGSDEPTRPLKGPHKDIRDMRQFLIDHCNYDPSDIIVLINTDDPGQAQPTKENIERHCVEMVTGARKGDRFFFHFAGHTTQKPTDGKEEEDGKDEYILTCDNENIQDNNLRKMLVDPLPVGAKLVAVFDACNSGTLLDLDHYRCNRVYVPWVSKGFRRTESRWNIVVRRLAIAGYMRSMTTDTQENIGLPALDSGSLSLNSVMPSPTTLPAQVVSEVFPIPPARRSATISANPAPDSSGRLYNCPDDTPMIFCDSPIAYFCTGHCNQSGSQAQFEVSDKADVVCLSSAEDCQRSWQDSSGSSLTQALIKFLERKPDATIEDVLTTVSHELHTFYLDLHRHARKYKRQVRDINRRRRVRGKPPLRQQTVEMDNFQDPQISSHRPLDMKRLWEM